MKIPAILVVMLLGVSWTAVADIEGDVRLVEGANEYEGRVEIFAGGRWGTVCSRRFGEPEGQVVCHQLGYGSVAMNWRPVSVMVDAYFGGNTELPINLADPFCTGVEDRLTDCDGDWGDDVSDCDHSQDVGLICSYGNETEGDIRLVGAGVGIESEGRIQILRHNLWGTICHHSWDLNDANVACRQLGFEFATFATRNSLYGGGNLDQTVMLSNVRCDGTEEHLLDCQNDGWGVEDCDYHQEDAGVVCAEETIEGTMRLTSGASENEGILEIYHDGSWGTICNDASWTEVEAVVACRHLGYDTLTSFGTPDNPMTGTIQLHAVNCYGYELTIGNCAHGEWGNPSSSCTHDTDVWLSCENKPVEEGDVRLVDGFTPSQGRVEYYDDHGEWVTVCDTVGDMKKAIVVCRQLGYLTASEAFAQSHFGPGSANQSMEAVRCHGYETSFEDCDHDLFGPADCAEHENDAGVICTDQANEGDLRLVNGSDYTEGRLEIFHNGQWGSICNTNWFGDDASVACRQMGLGNVKYAFQDFGPSQGPIHLDDVECSGTEMNITDCQTSEWGINDCGHDADVGMSCFIFEEPEDGDVRLTGGADYREGRVEVYQDSENSWFGVCGDASWDRVDAQVICNEYELDLESENEADFGPRLYPGFISNVECIGTESRFGHCTFSSQNENCEQVGIVCKEFTVSPSEGDVRVRDGTSVDEGRLEIYYDGVWGFICRTNWGRNEAQVACRQLGYDHVRQNSINTDYVDRPVHLDNVQCDGTEDKLVDCEHDPWGDNECWAGYGVGVACSATPVDEGLEGWEIALIVIFSVLGVGFGASAIGYVLYRNKTP